MTTTFEAIIEAERADMLRELSEIAAFPAVARALAERARQEELELKFHVFADHTNDFLTDPIEALALYLEHRTDGEPNVRLWYELVCPCLGESQEHDGRQHDDTGMIEENYLIGYGLFPL